MQLDLADGLPAAGVEARGEPVFLIVWWRQLLLGYEPVHRSITGAELATRVAGLIGPSVGRRLLGAGYPSPWAGLEPASAPAINTVIALTAPLRLLDQQARREADGGPPVTLAICTRDRPQALERCLRSIAAARPAPDEVIVVDNAPGTAATRAIVARFPGCRCVPEPRPGLSAARNAAVREASGELLAFVDDDVVVHPRWLGALRRGFEDDDVMAVMGLVLPAELATEAQAAFESIGGLALGSERARFDQRFVRATVARGIPVWKLGAGANMAVRRCAFELVGDFDARLGAGAAGCSEDSEFWYRLLAEGWACRYEPDSVVFHHHRREAAALARQIHEYTRGHVAALFVQFARFRHTGNLRRALLALPHYFARRTLRRLARPVARRARLSAEQPIDLYRPEITGYLRGLAYLPLAVADMPPRHKARLGAMLARNPFPRPYTLGFFYREKLRAIHRVAPDLPAAAVLEVGGGRSGVARLLYPAAHVTTVDVDEQHAVAEINRDPRVRFMVADATALPFPDDSFDVVTFFDVLEHIEDDARAADEAMRVLRPGGFALVTTPSERWRFPYYRALAPICPTDKDLIDEWGHVRRGYAQPDLNRLFGRPPVRTAGFINPLTALGHDLAWSKLPELARRGLCTVVSPLTWLAYAVQGASRPGTEIAASWRKPDH